MPRPSKAAGSVALVTGANRGIGLAFVRELTARGAKKVYAGVRDPDGLTDEFAGLPAEVVPLDVTDPAAVGAAAAQDSMIRAAGSTAVKRVMIATLHRGR